MPKVPTTGSDYAAHFYRKSYSLSSGEGLQVRFKLDQTNTLAHFSLEANDGTYRRFGVIANAGKLYVQYSDGSGYRYPADLLTGLQINTWYVLRLVVDDARGCYVEVYQESNPTVRSSYNQWLPAGLSWRFHHWIYRGNAYLDDYREFSATALTWSPDERMTFGYDALDRLTSAAPEGGTQGYNETYQYNPIGNMTSKGGVSYTYPASGPSSVRPHAVSSTSNGGSFGYDANGNMTSRRLKTGDPTYAQTWDYENRLLSVTVSGETTTLTYDGNGALVKKDDGVGVTIYAGELYERYEIPPGGPGIEDDFGDGDADGWSPTGGTWQVESGVYSGQDGSNQVSVWHLTMTTGKLGARVQTQSWPGHSHNGYLVFDYADGDN